MLILKGSNPIIRNILTLKGLPFTEQPAVSLSLETRDFELKDFDTIIQYIDERYPIPQIISGDVENRARIRELSKYLLQSPEECERLAKSANPFIFGKTVTLADLIAVEYTSNVKFKKFMTSVISNRVEGW